MKKSSSFQIERKSSIESEPRTLNLDHAREAALFVLSTKSIEEALSIFTEGLEPVVSAKKKSDRRTECEEEWDYLAGQLKITPLLTVSSSRDVVSAPF